MTDKIQIASQRFDGTSSGVCCKTDPIKSLLCGCIFLLLGITGYAQQMMPERGVAPAGSYLIGDIETISTTNGNLMLHIPLASLPAGRGGSSGYALRLLYNSKLWDGSDQEIVNEDGHDYPERFLRRSTSGGWRYALRYQLSLESRSNGGPCRDANNNVILSNVYPWKLRMIFPDGSAHEFRPTGYAGSGGYYEINYDGVITGCQGGGQVAGPMTYYSVDGSYTRLVFPHDGVTDWVLSDSNGGRVISANGAQRSYDRNGNYTEIQAAPVVNGHSVDKIVDQVGRTITIEYDKDTDQDYISSMGGNNEKLTWTVKWKATYINRNYSALDRCGTGRLGTKQLRNNLRIVDQIILPSQLGNLSYKFNYNGKSTPLTAPPDPVLSPGFGELNSVTLPSGAQVTYHYYYDADGPEGSNYLPCWKEVLDNSPVVKEQTYQLEYARPDSTTETWHYDISNVFSNVLGPDGGVTKEYYYPTDGANWSAGLVYKLEESNGMVIERNWQANTPFDTRILSNPYVKTEFTSIKDALGNLSKTAIKDYSYDKNGNITRVAEYDWVDYSSVHDSSGNPNWQLSGTPKLVMTNRYYNQTADATVTNVNDAASYHQLGAPTLRNALSSSEASNSSQTLARTEVFYDNANTTGNLTQQKSWDSIKGPLGSDPNQLTAGNSISVSRQYDSYGNLIISTDAQGDQTKYIYGPINGPGGQNFDLYPTQSIAAYGTTVQRTTTNEYDFYTGLVTQTTDTDNQVSTKISYDAYGRPKLIQAAIGQLEETRTSMTYDDVARRNITRSDLKDIGDEKLVKIQHYDQLGRVWLSRQLEVATSQAETDETAGIKVQVRYLSDKENNIRYQIVSNPYRAATPNDAGAETTMGWTLTKSDSAGRYVEVQSFAGSALPAPWGTNLSKTGVVKTSNDGIYTTVQDQMGRIRRSMTDGLGRLVRVDEPDANNNLDLNGSVVQPTSYTYDALSNLTQVRQGGTIQNNQYQGGQTRTFNYSSLSRLTSATNPESGTVKYEYYNDGNLKKRIDARNIEASYEYDGLKRLKLKHYTDGITPDAIYSYDAGSVPFSRGLLSSVTTKSPNGAIISATSYDAYDALGRIKQSTQTTDMPYTMRYGYNRAGALISEEYPSGRVVATEYDGAGRVAGVSNQKTSTYYAGGAPDSDTRVQYTAHGAAAEMRIGNGLWEYTDYNSRLQPVEIDLGSKSNPTSVLDLTYYYGGSDNNGNVRSQTIKIPGLTNALVQNYSYDFLNRLQSANEMSGGSQSWIQKYKYDQYGNRNFDAGTTFPDFSTAGIDPATGLPLDPVKNPKLDPANNRIKDGQGYAYDNAGNVTGAPNQSFIYDAENRQISYSRYTSMGSNGEGGGKVVVDERYTYDGDGRRIKKGDQFGITTTYVYDAMGRLAAEYSNDAPSGAGGTSYLTMDTLGTPRVVTGASNNGGNGNVIARHDYAPFGEEITRSGAGYGGNDGERQKFTGQERDSESGLDYMHARYYGSSMGRFTSPDDFLNDTHVYDPASWNLYVYVRNNPLKLIDPSGEVVNGAGLSAAERQQLIEDWQRKTGYAHIYFDSNNNLTIDRNAGINKDANGNFLGSADARANLSDAVEATDKIFNLEHANNSNQVGFADTQLTSTSRDSVTNITTYTYQVRLDFDDFRHMSGDREARDAHSIGIIALHEIDHNLYGSIVDAPNGPNDPGPVETKYINPIREQLGLAQRATYTAVPPERGLRNFYPGYVQIRFTLNGKDKILRWQDAVVGGIHN